MHVNPELCASGVVDVGGAGCDFVRENTVAGVVAEVDDATYCYRGGGWGMVGRGFGDCGMGGGRREGSYGGVKGGEGGLLEGRGMG